jgi:branched-subunit amino acid aminotransferase/4-amino-4-deoxychorismate lyase
MLEQLPIEEVNLTLAELVLADEIIATNCLGIRQLVELDSKTISSEPILLSRAQAVYAAMT